MPLKEFSAEKKTSPPYKKRKKKPVRFYFFFRWKKTKKPPFASFRGPKIIFAHSVVVVVVV